MTVQTEELTDRQSFLLNLFQQLNKVESRQQLMSFVFVAQQLRYAQPGLFSFDEISPLPYSSEIDSDLEELERRRLVVDLAGPDSIYVTTRGAAITIRSKWNLALLSSKLDGQSCTPGDMSKMLAASALSFKPASAVETRRLSSDAFGMTEEEYRSCLTALAAIEQP